MTTYHNEQWLSPQTGWNITTNNVRWEIDDQNSQSPIDKTNWSQQWPNQVFDSKTQPSSQLILENEHAGGEELFYQIAEGKQSWDKIPTPIKKTTPSKSLPLPSKVPQLSSVRQGFVSVNEDPTAWDPTSQFLKSREGIAEPIQTKTMKSPNKKSPAKDDKRFPDIEEELNHQSLYKTELCRSWGETGTCRYGSKCQFAHGHDELRPVMRHPKYKTEICRTFHTLGTCPYGTRCRFIHNRAGPTPQPEWNPDMQRSRSASIASIPSSSHSQSGSDVSLKPSPPQSDLLSQQRFHQLPPEMQPYFVEHDESEELAKATASIEQLTLSWDPPSPVDEKKKKKKSRLPFFQLLSEKKSDKKSSKEH